MLGLWVADEIQSSRLQARTISAYAATLTYDRGAGASTAIRFPTHGPFDERMGYQRLPEISQRLIEAGYSLTHQARLSPALQDYIDRGFFPPYREKASAGLSLAGCRQEALYRFRYPYRGYTGFDAVPKRIAETLIFIENRDLFDPERPGMNPAVDWVRFSRAAIGRIGRWVDEDFNAPGGSTLATQIEKYRHSPNGVTPNSEEKLRQMVSASVRAYRDGPHTLPARERILVDYLNTVPLFAAPGFGEVNGLADGLWVWFGADFDTVNALLAAPEVEGESADGPRAAQATALQQVVALMIAHRRPSYYLSVRGRNDLRQLVASHVRLLAHHGLIGASLRDAALAQELQFRDLARNPATLPADAGKGAMAIRNRLAGQLGVSLYELDRLDAEVATTLDGRLQQWITDYLDALAQPEIARGEGLVGERMLATASLGAVRYSFTLVESTPEGNRVRVQTDTTGQPLDINEGSKLELGSTAKLRVLATYLEIVAELHARHGNKTVEELRQLKIEPRDHISRWAVAYLIGNEARALPEMLQAALERRYSANPDESFFTGGGVHRFSNFRREDDGREPTVREAMQASINLAFVRLMRDVVRFAMFQVPESSAHLIQERNDPRRAEYLARFADSEGQVFLRRFWVKYRGKSAAEIQEIFLGGLRHTPDRLAAAFRYFSPDSPPEALAAFLNERLNRKDLGDARIAQLYQRYRPDAFDLPDRAHIAREHPLELWLVRHLMMKPDSTWREAVDASREERQAVYRWLFKTRFKDAQDTRIATMLEVEAFLDIHRRWARLGYPFDHLVPSLATALGSSGDRPAALADLMGIIVNDGIRLPTRRINYIAFARNTPYETDFAGISGTGERVMAPEVAVALRHALSEVVESGTARRLAGSLKLADGSALSLGGKTGTGDNRIVLGKGGNRGVAMNRTATFVFYLGPRHFGTLTAYVMGPEAANYRFTSALPVQILKSMAPQLLSALDPASDSRCPVPASPSIEKAAITKLEP